MKPAQELIDNIYAEKVLRARQMPIGAKLLAGPQLLIFACEAMRAGIRVQHPDTTPQQVEELLKQRLALGERLDGSRHG